MKNYRILSRIGLAAFFSGLLIAEIIIFAHTGFFCRMSHQRNKASMKAQIGGVVFFGRYEQDDDLSNGPEDIEWIVLDKQDERLLMTTLHVLDKSIWGDGAWEESRIRQKLNQAFFFSAFCQAERNMIVPTCIFTEDQNNLKEGGITEDRVFILNMEEAEKYLLLNENRIAYMTRYADDFGWYDVWDGPPGTLFDELFKKPVPDYPEIWWLRTKGGEPDHIAYVNQNGQIDKAGQSIDTDAGIRPVIWIDLSNGGIGGD